jgi:hypothetical protein
LPPSCADVLNSGSLNLLEPLGPVKACSGIAVPVRKVAVHLGYGTYICLTVSKLPLQCAVVSLYSVVKQRLKCNTGKVFHY